MRTFKEKDLILYVTREGEVHWDPHDDNELYAATTSFFGAAARSAQIAAGMISALSMWIASDPRSEELLEAVNEGVLEMRRGLGPGGDLAGVKS